MNNNNNICKSSSGINIQNNNISIRDFNNNMNKEKTYDKTKKTKETKEDQIINQKTIEKNQKNQSPGLHDRSLEELGGAWRGLEEFGGAWRSLTEFDGV